MQTAATATIPSPALDLSDCVAEAQYSRGVPAEHRRKFGQVFTPPKLAMLMADWVMSSSPRSLLDPAYGTGILTAACLACNVDLDVEAYEIDDRVLEFSRSFGSNVKVNNRDFLREKITDRFDAVVMNPPYIRHREISGYETEMNLISEMSNVSIPRSANLYIYFSIKALELLRPNGKAAILIPAEWMSANFSKSFKRYLLDRGILKNIVTFSNCSNVFDDALTTASLILCEK